MPSTVMLSFVDRPGPNETLKIGNKEVHLWWGTDEVSGEQVSLLSQLLSETERIRADRYHFPIDRRRFIVRHGALRILIGRYLSIGPKQIKYHVNRYGKPFIENSSQEISLLFNLSYSNQMVLYAFTRGRRIGVDIEFMKSIPDMDAVAHNLFSSKEKAEISALPACQRQEAFYKCWTQKESFVKALGDGLSRRLDQFDVSVKPETPAELKSTDWDQYEAARWSLKTLTLVPGYTASLAVEGSGWSLCCWQLTPDMMVVPKTGQSDIHE
jgi:4'-phosphopantetheinyl transferase